MSALLKIFEHVASFAIAVLAYFGAALVLSPWRSRLRLIPWKLWILLLIAAAVLMSRSLIMVGLKSSRYVILIVITITCCGAAALEFVRGLKYGKAMLAMLAAGLIFAGWYKIGHNVGFYRRVSDTFDLFASAVNEHRRLHRLSNPCIVLLDKRSAQMKNFMDAKAFGYACWQLADLTDDKTLSRELSRSSKCNDGFYIFIRMENIGRLRKKWEQTGLGDWHLLGARDDYRWYFVANELPQLGSRWNGVMPTVDPQFGQVLIPGKAEPAESENWRERLTKKKIDAGHIAALPDGFYIPPERTSADNIRKLHIKKVAPSAGIPAHWQLSSVDISSFLYLGHTLKTPYQAKFRLIYAGEIGDRVSLKAIGYKAGKYVSSIELQRFYGLGSRNWRIGETSPTADLRDCDSMVFFLEFQGADMKIAHLDMGRHQ